MTTVATFETFDDMAQIECALWSALKNHKGFGSLISAGNLLALNDPNAEEVDDMPRMDADVPSITIEPVGMQSNITGNVANSELSQSQWRFKIVSDSARPSKSLFPLCFQLRKLLAKIENVGPDKILGLDFVNQLEVQPIIMGLRTAGTTESKGLGVWVAEAIVEVHSDIPADVMVDDT